MAMGGKNLKARVRHRGSLQGGTEILIDRLDEEKKRKVLHYLWANQMEPVAGEEDQLISVEVSVAESKRVSDKILSYMRSIGLDDVSVSSAHFDGTRPEIEEESLPGQDYTLVDSEDVRELARRLEAGEESEFELIVSSIPDAASLPGGGRWRSSDVIRTINGSTRQNEGDVSTLEGNEQSNAATIERTKTEQILQSKKSKWWRRKASRFMNLFKRKNPQKTEHEIAQTLTTDVKHLSGDKLNPSKLAEQQGFINKKTNIQSDNLNKTLRRLSDIGLKRLKPLKNVKKILKVKEMKVSEAYTQTNRKNNRKFTNYKSWEMSKEKSSKKSGTTNMSSSGECCTCCSTDCTSATIHPQLITLTGGVNRNLPFYQPLWGQPYCYLCHQNPFQQVSNYTARPPQERILVESCNTFTQTTTSETTNTVTCSTTSRSSCITRHERKTYRKKSRPQERRKCEPQDIRKMKRNESKLEDESFSVEENIRQTDSSAHTCKKSTTFRSSKTMKNSQENIHYNSFKNKTLHRDFHKLSKHCKSNNINFFEEQLTELHEKIEEIALRIEAKRLDTIVKSFELSTKDKKPVETVDRGVECTGMNYIVNYHQNELESMNESNSNKAKATEVTVENKEKSDAHVEEMNNELRDDKCTDENEHFVLKPHKISEEEKPMKNGKERTTGTRSKRRIRTEENMRRGITWGQYPDGRYGYRATYDSGLVVPITTWGPNYSLSLPLLQGQSASREHRKKRTSRCMKLCSFLTGDKSSNIREQLLQQKLDLLEMKTVLTAINHTIREEKRYPREQGDDISESDELYSEDNQESSEDYSSEENVNKCENGENKKDDIQFSLSRPKVSKKTVTFRTPLID